MLQHEKSQYLQLNAWFQMVRALHLIKPVISRQRSVSVIYRCFFLQHWFDPHLSWNASEYGGLKSLRIPSTRLWIPDVVLYNK